MEKTEKRQLLLLLILSTFPRLYQINSEFITREDWGLAQLAVYVRNYLEIGFLETRFLPVFGVIGEENIYYVNHPFLMEVLNAVWCRIFGMSETTMRTFAVLISVLTILVIYRLGRQFWGHQAGLLAAFFYGFAPMSIYIGRTPNIESGFYFFSFLGLSLIIDWTENKKRSSFALASLSLLLGVWCDHFGLYLVPFIFLIALGRKSKGIFLFSLVPVVGYILYLSHIAMVTGLAELAVGASKYVSPWDYWVNPDYYKVLVQRIFWNYAGLPPLLALFGIGKLLSRYKKFDVQSVGVWLCPILGLVVTDFAISCGFVYIHVFRVLFVGAPIALLAAYCIKDWSKSVKVAVVILSTLLLILPFKELFTPTNALDPNMAREVRKLTTDKDLLIGVPPNMAYYLNRKSMVPYAYAWAGGVLYKKPEDVFARLRPLAEHREYDRLVLFTQFLLNPTGSIKEADFSQTFDGVPGWRRVTKPSIDPQVWEREEISK